MFFKNNPNPQTWCIAGFPWNKIYSDTSQNLLSCAVKHLKERYKFVGILESIEAFENEIARFYGWSWKPIYEQTKITFNRPKVRDLTESDKTLLQKSLSLDIQLYDEAIRLIESGSQGRYTPPNSHTTGHTGPHNGDF